MYHYIHTYVGMYVHTSQYKHSINCKQTVIQLITLLFRLITFEQINQLKKLKLLIQIHGKWLMTSNRVTESVKAALLVLISIFQLNPFAGNTHTPNIGGQNKSLLTT